MEGTSRPDEIPRTERSRPRESPPLAGSTSISGSCRASRACSGPSASATCRSPVRQQREALVGVDHRPEADLIQRRPQVALGSPPRDVAGDERLGAAALAELERAGAGARLAVDRRAVRPRRRRTRAARRSRSAAPTARRGSPGRGCARKKRTRSGRGASTAKRLGSSRWPSGVVSHRRPLASTAPAFSGVPSWNLTPARTRKLQIVSPADEPKDSRQARQPARIAERARERRDQRLVDLPGHELVGARRGEQRVDLAGGLPARAHANVPPSPGAAGADDAVPGLVSPASGQQQAGQQRAEGERPSSHLDLQQDEGVEDEQEREEDRPAVQVALDQRAADPPPPPPPMPKAPDRPASLPECSRTRKITATAISTWTISSTFSTGRKSRWCPPRRAC